MNEMNITSAQYVTDQLSGNTSCIKATIDGITMSVPLDPANRHFSAIMKAVEDGELIIQEANPT